jgi:hypothetical protein
MCCCTLDSAGTFANPVLECGSSDSISTRREHVVKLNHLDSFSRPLKVRHAPTSHKAGARYRIAHAAGEAVTDVLRRFDRCASPLRFRMRLEPVSNGERKSAALPVPVFKKTPKRSACTDCGESQGPTSCCRKLSLWHHSSSLASSSLSSRAAA